MTKFHINKHGVPAPCKASVGKCPYGGESGSDNHFDTAREAQEAADAINSSKFGSLPGLPKKSIKEARETSKRILNSTVKRTLSSMSYHKFNSISEGNFGRGYAHFIENGGEKDLLNLIERNEPINHEVEQRILADFRINDESADSDRAQIKRVAEVVEDLRVVTKTHTEERAIEKALAERNVERTISKVQNEVMEKGLKVESESQAEEAADMFERLAKSPRLSEHSDMTEASNWYSRNRVRELDSDKGSIAGRTAAFKMAKEFHDNKVLYSALPDKRHDNIETMKGKLKDILT